MPSIKVEGLSKLSKELKKVSAELPKELKQVSKDAAEVVAEDARARGPVRSGRLVGRVKAAGTARGGQVRIAGLPYIKPIVFGWARHNIAPNPFPYDALDARRDEVIEKFRKGVNDLMDRNFTPGV